MADHTVTPTPEKQHPSRVQRGIIVLLLVIGWLLLLYAADSPLLAAIQGAALGLGALISALVATLWGEHR